MYGSYIILDVLVYLCFSYVDYNLYISCIIDSNLQPICYYVHVYVRKHINLFNSTFFWKVQRNRCPGIEFSQKMCMFQSIILKKSLLWSIYVYIERQAFAVCGSTEYCNEFYIQKDTNFDVLVNLYYQQLFRMHLVPCRKEGRYCNSTNKIRW